MKTDDEEMAREFNIYFGNVFTAEDVDNISRHDNILACEITLTDIDCNEPKIEAKLEDGTHIWSLIKRADVE